MRQRLWLSTVLALLSAGLAAAVPSTVHLAFDSFQVPDDTVLTGEVKPSAGRVIAVEPWLFLPGDTATATGWSCRLDRFDPPRERADGRRAGRPLPPAQVTPKAVLVTVDAPADATLTVATSAGEATLALGDLRDGRAVPLLDGLVTATRSAPVERLTTDRFANDYPAVAVAPTGEWAVAWVGFDNTADHLLLRRSGSPDVTEVSAGAGDFHRPALAFLGGDLLVVWPAQVEPGNFELLARTVTATGLSPVRRLTDRSGTDFLPRLSRAPDGAVWLAWQAWSGTSFDIRAARLTASGLSDELAVTSDPANDWEPDLTIAPDGAVWVAWDTYRHGSYDIYVRRLAPGAPGPETPVAASGDYEAHASLAVTGDGTVWVAYDNGGPNWATVRGSSLHRTRTLGLRGLAAGRLVEPAAPLVAALPVPYRDRPELPVLSVGPSGELVVCFRRVTVLNGLPPNGPNLQQSRGIWNVYTLASTATGWTAAAPLGLSNGRNDMRCELARTPGQPVVAAYAADDRVRQRSEVFELHHVQLATLPPTTGAAPPASRPAEAPDPAALPRDVGRPEPARWSLGEQSFRLMLGDTHRHTDVSRCSMCNDGSLLDTYRYAYDAAKLDYLGISDHDQDILRHRYDRNARPFDGYAWWRSEKFADLMNHPPVFVALFGYEHGGGYNDRGGHKNVLYDVRGRPCLEDDAPEALFAALGDFNAVVIPHQLADGSSATDWGKWKYQWERVAEIYQARGSYEHETAPQVAQVKRSGNYYQDALRRGLRVGAIASSDHGLTHSAYAGAWVADATRTGVLEALQSRRTYGATETVRIEFSVGALPAGSEVMAGPARLDCRVWSPAPIQNVEIVRDGQYVYTAPGTGQELRFTWADNAPAPGDYYYLRVTLTNGDLAWTSPIWFGAAG